MEKLYYLDISKWQGNFNPELAKRNGISGIFLRAMYSVHTDICFEENYDRCLKSGIDIGVYHFGRWHYREENNGNFENATIEMNKEVDAFIKLISEKKITSWVAIDQELEHHTVNHKSIPYTMGLNPKENTILLNRAGAKIKEAGFAPCLYASASWIDRHVDLSSLQMPLWVAYYPCRNVSPNRDPDFSDVVDFRSLEYSWAKWMARHEDRIIAWQFGSIGFGKKYGGESVNIDRNIVYQRPIANNDAQYEKVSSDTKLVVCENKKHAVQAFSIDCVDDRNYENLAPGEYRVTHIGPVENITPSLSGKWVKIDNSKHPYVLVVDGREDEVYMSTVNKVEVIGTGKNADFLRAILKFLEGE